MANEPPPLHTPMNYHVQSAEAPMDGPDHGPWSNGHPSSGEDYPGLYSAASMPVDRGGYSFPERYTGNMGREDSDPPHATTGLVEHRRSQSYYCGHPTPGQYIQVAHGPPRLEYHAPVAPVPNDRVVSRAPLPNNVAGPSRGNSGTLYSGISTAEDLKRLASHYVHNPDSHVDKIRMKRSRSGRFKVLIMLEIDDAT